MSEKNKDKYHALDCTQESLEEADITETQSPSSSSKPVKSKSFKKPFFLTKLSEFYLQLQLCDFLSKFIFSIFSIYRCKNLICY